MQKLVRTDKGELIVTEVTDAPQESKPRNPIVSPDNFPSQANVPQKPVKSDLQGALLNEDQLIQKMKEAGGKNLNTTQFALLITPNIKKSVDPIGHHKWDISRGIIRSMMKSLEAQGKIVITTDATSKKVRYLYNLK